MPYSNITLVCINPNTTLSVFFSMYQSRYNSLYILEYLSIQIQLALKLYTLYTVSIQIQLSLHSSVCINPDTTCSQTLYPLHENYNTLVCINSDTTLSVFLGMYQSRYNSLCILRYISIQIQLSLYS